MTRYGLKFLSQEIWWPELAIRWKQMGFFSWTSNFISPKRPAVFPPSRFHLTFRHVEHRCLRRFWAIFLAWASCCNEIPENCTLNLQSSKRTECMSFMNVFVNRQFSAPRPIFKCQKYCFFCNGELIGRSATNWIFIWSIDFQSRFCWITCSVSFMNVSIDNFVLLKNFCKFQIWGLSACSENLMGLFIQKFHTLMCFFCIFKPIFFRKFAARFFSFSKLPAKFQNNSGLVPCAGNLIDQNFQTK